MEQPDAQSSHLYNATSKTEIANAIRRAATNNRTLRIAAQNEWLNAGRPTSTANSELLSVAALSGITQYVPGDLVITARAATTLAEIQQAAVCNNQWLALDPYGTDNGTIGATIATGSSGPLAPAYGKARDLVLGITAVTGNAAVITVGGRVVKNVAGFDLVRLLTGSWGTLAVITEVTLRLHALPQNELTIAVSLKQKTIQQQLSALRAAPLSAMSLQLIDAATANLLSQELSHELTGEASDSPVLLARIGGNSARILAQRSTLAALGSIREVNNAIWSSLRAFETHHTVSNWCVLRASVGMAGIAQILQLLQDTATSPHSLSHSSPFVYRYNAAVESGIVRIIAPPASAVAIIAALQRAGVRVVGETLTDIAWKLLPPPNDSITAAIRQQFDPHAVLNTGIMGAMFHK